MASANLQAKVQALNAKMEGQASMVIEGLEKRQLRPIARKSYECVLKCYDKAGTTGSSEQLQQCSQQCQIPFQRAQSLLQDEVNQFQNRLNRSMMECQDKARDLVTGDIQNDARQMRKFEDTILSCMTKTVDTYIGLLDPMSKRIERNLK